MSDSKTFVHLNTFDFLRWVAAFVVIFAHSYALAGQLWWPVTEFNGNRMTFFAVACFFVISGYLVTQSWIAHPNLKAFLLKRVLRLLPGLLAASVVTSIVIGALTTSLDLGTYFTQIQTWLYPLRSLTLYGLQYTLPGVFLDNPHAGVVNGSLWTLPMEFTAYLVVAALGVVSLIRNRSILVGVLALTVVASLMMHIDGLPLPSKITSILEPLLYFLMYFMVGSLFFVAKDSIQLSAKWAMIAAFVFAIAWLLPHYQLIGLLSFSYLVYYLGLKLPLAFNLVRKWGDLSYGMYIYAYPVQQAIVSLSPHKLHPLIVLGLTMIVVIPLAWLSWHLVEAPALKLKPKKKN